MRLQPLLHAHAVAASGTYGYSPCHIRLQVSDPIRFPEVLDISPYTRDGAATAAGTAAAGTAAAHALADTTVVAAALAAALATAALAAPQPAAALAAAFKRPRRLSKLQDLSRRDAPQIEE